MKKVHSINLFQTLTTGFDEEEVDYQRGTKIAASEDVAVGEIDLVSDQGGEETEVEVEELLENVVSFGSVNRIEMEEEHIPSWMRNSKR